MMTPTKDPMDKVEAITNAWKLNAPDAIFAGMTLEKFTEAMAPSINVRRELTETYTRLATLLARRAEIDKAAALVLDRVIAGVRADPAHGTDSPLWAAMGFVRKSARKKGLTRKTKKKVAPASPQTDSEKSQE
jgi:hypothetical protein